MKPIYVKI